MSRGEVLRGSVLLTGGSGMVGQALAHEFQSRGLRVIQGVRGEVMAPNAPDGAGNAEQDRIAWRPKLRQSFADQARLEGLDVAIHLSGANLAARRWTVAYKREIVSSRTVTTDSIARSLAALKRPPRLLITASATGIYGDRGSELLTEESSLGADFLSETCVAWEAAARPAVDAGIRVIHLRLGVVLDQAGGALAKVLPLFKLGLGGRLGNGAQWMSWVAIDDVVRSVMHLAGLGAEPGVGAGLGLEEVSLEGAVNCVSPVPVTNADYTRALAEVVHRPAFMAAPAFALKLALGEMADAALLSSCRAVPQKLIESGFRFRYPEVGSALGHLLGEGA